MEEVKALRAKHVNVSDKVVKGGQYLEVTGFKSVQVGSCMHACAAAASSIHRPFVMHACLAALIDA